jgi:hypothetical protein
MKAVFIARAGVLIDGGEPMAERGPHPRLRCGAGGGLRRLAELDFRLVVIEDGGLLASTVRPPPPRRRRDDPRDTGAAFAGTTSSSAACSGAVNSGAAYSGAAYSGADAASSCSGAAPSGATFSGGTVADGPAASPPHSCLSASSPQAAIADRLDDLLFREQVAMQGFYCCTHGGAGMTPGASGKRASGALGAWHDGHSGPRRSGGSGGAADQAGCACAPPQPGLLLRAAFEHRIDLPGSWLIGASLDLVEAGNRAGCRTVLIDNGTETAWRLGRGRVPTRIAPDLHAAALLIEGDGARRLPW